MALRSLLVFAISQKLKNFESKYLCLDLNSTDRIGNTRQNKTCRLLARRKPIDGALILNFSFIFLELANTTTSDSASTFEPNIFCLPSCKIDSSLWWEISLPDFENTTTALPAVTRYTLILSLITDSLSGIRLYLIAARSAVTS